MPRIITLLALAGLLYFGYVNALPWIEARVDGLGLGGSSSAALGGGDEEEMRCLRLAEQADETFSTVMRQFSRPPVDQQEWTGAFLTVSGDVGSAESACSCAGAACAPASEAMAELRELSLSFDGIVRGSARGMGNPASRQARVQELLGRARRLAGSS